MNSTNVGVIAFAFDFSSTSKMNLRLAGYASLHSICHNRAPIFAQSVIRMKPDANVSYTGEREGAPGMPTLRFARLAAGWAEQHEIDRIYVVAALPHMWRACRDLRLALAEKGLATSVVRSYIISLTAWRSWFDPSAQSQRVRTPWAWLLREIPLRMMPVLMYKSIAS